ncbi:MAG: hypothetical protein HOF77_00240 [Actinobacteria bacterium]|jgi:hypothetical protein|nr:hypothetical protein [Actinomycetota bacterium]
MKYLLLNFKEMPTYGWIEYSEEKGLILSEQKMFSSFLDIKDLVNTKTCIIVDALATDEPTLSISLENILKSNYSITTQKVTNALKKIDSTGKVVSHLNRENYQRLSTPIKASGHSISQYFDKNSSWDFEKYLRLNNHSYKDYQTFEAELILEPK